MDRHGDALRRAAGVRAAVFLAVACAALVALLWQQQQGGSWPFANDDGVNGVNGHSGGGGGAGGGSGAESTVQSLDADAQVLLYMPSESLGRQLLTFKLACALAVRTNRTLVLPMVATPPADGAVSLNDASKVEWAPLERYVQPQPLRDLPCATASMAALRQWLAKYGKSHGSAKKAMALQYVVVPGRASASAAQLRVYYEGVLGLPAFPPARASIANSNSRNSVSELVRALAPFNASAVLAIGTLGSIDPDTDRESVAKHERITRGVVLHKRIRELARRLQAALFHESAFIGVHAWRSQASLDGCARLPSPADRALCTMPPLVVDGALYDVRTAMAAGSHAAAAGGGAAGAGAAAGGGSSAGGLQHLGPPATVHAYVTVHTRTLPMGSWDPILYGHPNATIVLAPSTLLVHLALPEIASLGLLAQYRDLNAVERTLLDMEMCLRATWFIGNPFSAVSTYITERRSIDHGPNYFLTKTSPYTVFGD